MTGLDHVAVTALGPVREALLTRAHHAADAVVGTARAEAAQVVHDAEQQATAVVERARAEGEADAATALASDRAKARRRARGVVLVAQQQAYEELRERVRERARAISGDPSWPSLRAVLESRARAALGPPGDGEALTVEDVPGGVRVTAASRRATATLDALADAALGALGPEVEQLWSP